MSANTLKPTNDENAAMAPPKRSPAPPPNTGERRVLGDVSPNLKKQPAFSAVRGKPMAGSPLKRSFTAAMEGGEGFTYLKRRKISDDEYLGDQDASRETSQSQLGDSQFRPLLQPPRDEMTVPEIHEPSPTEPNTPSSDDGDDTQGSSQDRKSFSSLINYDPLSQTSNVAFKNVSNAEMLRLRLRVAMYKVRTNQVEVPFSNLQVERGELRSPQQEAVEEAVAQLRREAFEIQARDERRQQKRPEVSQLLPAPLLKPTAYSSRMIYESGLPSSPPASRSPERFSSERAGVTPRRCQVVDLMSPEKCDGECERELTSSAVKGRVAEGLLGLRHAV